MMTVLDEDGTDDGVDDSIDETRFRRNLSRSPFQLGGPGAAPCLDAFSQDQNPSQYTNHTSEAKNSKNQCKIHRQMTALE